MKQKQSVVAIFPDGSKFNGEIERNFNDECFYEIDYKYKDFAQKALLSQKKTCSRKNPKETVISVYNLNIKNGEIEQKLYKFFNLQLPFAKMTETEYEEIMKELLSELPSQFHGFISSQAWERGHAYGYEEVISIAEDFVFSLSPAIKEFTDFLAKTSLNNKLKKVNLKVN